MKGLIKTEYHQTGLFISFQNQINTESTLRKLLCKPKDRVATEDKNNIVCETDLLKSRSDEHKRIAIVIRMKSQNTVGKQITTLAGIRRKLLIGKAG